MLYSIIMKNGTALRAGAHCGRHRQMKTTEVYRHSANPSITTINAHFKTRNSPNLVVSSHVRTLKHKVEQQQLKEPFPCYKPLFDFVF